jgi:hypothetical protein
MMPDSRPGFGQVIDWRSSYGHGPFLVDLAPFLVNDARGLATFVTHSDVCRSATRAEIERWLYAANCAGFAGSMLCRLADPPTARRTQDRDACRALLAYEYPAYRGIVQQIPKPAD